MKKRFEYVNRLYEKKDIISLHRELKTIDRIIFDYETQLVYLFWEKGEKDIEKLEEVLNSEDVKKIEKSLISEEDFKNYIKKLISKIEN